MIFIILQLEFPNTCPGKPENSLNHEILELIKSLIFIIGEKPILTN